MAAAPLLPPARFLGRIPTGGTLEPLPEQPRGKINTTDADSRSVKTPRGYTQDYNAQAVVNAHQIGPALMLCSLELVGRVGDQGWKLAERLTPIAYIAWSLWLMATGVAVIA